MPVSADASEETLGITEGLQSLVLSFFKTKAGNGKAKKALG